MESIFNIESSKGVKLTVRLAVAVFLFFLTNNVYAYKVYAFDSKEVNLDINASINAGYDGNITHGSSDQKLYEDYFSKLGLEFGLHFDGKDRSAHLLGDVWRTLYKEYSDFNETAGGGTFQYIDELSKYDTIKLSNTYYETFKAGSIEEAFGRIGGRYKQLTNDLLLSYRRELAPNLSVTASYCNVYVKSDVSGDKKVKSYKNSWTLESEYKYTNLTSFTSFYEFSKTDYDGIDSDIKSHTIAAGIRRFVTRQLFVDALAGVDFVERTVNNNEHSGTGGYIKLLMINQFKNTNMRFSIEKSKDANVVRDELLDSWRFSGSITRQLLKRLNTTTAFFYGYGNYASLNITEKLWGSDIGLKYSFTEHLYGSFNYVYSEKDVTGPSDDLNYKRNSVTFGLNALF